MLVRFICPYIYSVLVGISWSGLFKKKFSESLAPAFLIQIVIVFLSGVTGCSLSFGVFAGFLFAVFTLLFVAISHRGQMNTDIIKEYLLSLWNEGLWVFSVFYFFCFIMNYQKRFLTWDEFSHWGMFLKENLRLDRLYCMSPVQFVHKDYVPAISLFETIWCKISGRFNEADAYRGIQVFMFSLLLPMIECSSKCFSSDIKKNNSNFYHLRKHLSYLLPSLFVLMLPLIFDPNNGFMFYHSIYCDMVEGIVFFYCIFEVYRTNHYSWYNYGIITLSCTILVLTKMSAMALLPLIMALFLANCFWCLAKKEQKRAVLLYFPTIGIPIILWTWYNRFVDKYIPDIGSAQSYDGMKWTSVIDVFISTSDSSIPYIEKLRSKYVYAVIHRDVLLHGSYIVVLIFCVLGFIVLSNIAVNGLTKKKLIMAGVWTMLSGIMYVFLMFFLYATAFSEQEAVNLASYERYMNSFLIAIIFFLVASYFDCGVMKDHLKSFYILLFVLSVELSFFHIESFDQLLPGALTDDDGKIAKYTDYSDIICDMTPEESKVFIVKRGDDGDFYWHMCFYCSPRTIWGGSVGPAVDENDIWSADYTVEAFSDSVSQCDYIFFCEIDDMFIEKYSNIFTNITKIENGGLYKISINDAKVVLDNITSK